MSRGFDWFELDDSRDCGFDTGREIGGSSSSSSNAWLVQESMRREEERSDNLGRDGRERTGQERPPLPREQRVQSVLEQRIRTRHLDRNSEYSLRDSEIRLLSEVGKFRVVAVSDLAEFAYNGDRARVENDVENLVRHLKSLFRLQLPFRFAPRRLSGFWPQFRRPFPWLACSQRIRVLPGRDS